MKHGCGLVDTSVSKTPRVQAEGPKLRFPALMKRLSVVVHAYKDLGRWRQ